MVTLNSDLKQIENHRATLGQEKRSFIPDFLERVLIKLGAFFTGRDIPLFGKDALLTKIPNNFKPLDIETLQNKQKQYQTNIKTIYEKAPQLSMLDEQISKKKESIASLEESLDYLDATLKENMEAGQSQQSMAFDSSDMEGRSGSTRTDLLNRLSTAKEELNALKKERAELFNNTANTYEIKISYKASNEECVALKVYNIAKSIVGQARKESSQDLRGKVSEIATLSVSLFGLSDHQESYFNTMLEKALNEPAK